MSITISSPSPSDGDGEEIVKNATLGVKMSYIHPDTALLKLISSNVFHNLRILNCLIRKF